MADANVGEIIIYVRDLARMKRFYSEQLGFRIVADRGRLVAFSGNAGAEIVLHGGREDSRDGGNSWLLQIIVPDIDKAVLALRERGVAISDVEQRPYGRYARFSDPEGNQLGLEQA
ncbi:MAG: VOC family protein [Chloroflexi bacterium]|nr:VOC family protein [Chloroflexota bacterium]